MKVQQYKVAPKDCSFALAEIGQFVLHDKDSDVAIGFIADTDNESFIEVFLFDQEDSVNLPDTIWDIVEESDFGVVFAAIEPNMSDEVRDAWEEALVESSAEVQQ